MTKGSEHKHARRDWYDWMRHPGTSFHEMRAQRKERRELERKSYIQQGEGGMFLNYPLDKFVTRGWNPFFIIPEGYAGVRMRFGKIGRVDGSSDDEEGIETDVQGNPIRRKRTFPGGGALRPGFHAAFSYKGLLSRFAVVDMRDRPTDEKFEGVPFEGGALRLPIVEAVMNWRVRDPVKALINTDNYRDTVNNVAEYVIKHEFETKTLDDLQNKKDEITVNNNLAPTRQRNKEQYEILVNAGVEIGLINIKDYDFPEEIKPFMQANTKARELAQAELKTAQIRKRTAEAHAEIAKSYADPNARFVRALEAADGRVTYNASEVESDRIWGDRAALIADKVTAGFVEIFKKKD